MSTDITQEWLDQHRDLIRKTVCPQGIPDAEFELFMLQCERSGLDPLLKQAFCVAREAKGEVLRDERGNPLKEQGSNGKWYDKRARITRYEFQPSEAGMLARAERFPDFRGVYAGAVWEGDECMVDEGAGVVVHRFSPAKRTGRLIGAWARLERTGRAPMVKWLDLSAYAQTTQLWSSKPATMIEKCARVAVLRQAYPEQFGGLYTAEERAPEDGEVVESTAHPVGATSKPALPAETATAQAAPRLEQVAEAELVPASREPGEDDGEANPFVDANGLDPIQKEAATILEGLAAAKTLEEVRSWHKRAIGLPKHAPEYKQVADAYAAARSRVTQGSPS